MRVLALESSTSAAKAMLFCPEQGVVRELSRPYGPGVDKDGVQDTLEVFRLTMELGRELAAGEKIAAVAVCGTWHSIAVLDRAMRPVTGTYTWAWLGAADHCRRIRADRELTARLYGGTGCMPHVTYMRHALWHLREQGMDFADKRFASQSAYHFYRLTGGFRESRSTASGAGLLNLRTLEYDPLALELLGIAPAQLGEPAGWRDTLPLSGEGARLLGLPAGTPVVPGHPDGALNQIGSGAARRGRMTVSVGTSAAIRLTAPAPVLPEGRQTWCYVGVEDWIAGAATAGACNCVNWFRDTLLGGKWSFQALEAEPGRSMPVFLPFLFGERCPGWNDQRRGGFQDLRPEHTVHDLYNGLRAGILFHLLQCCQALCAAAGEPDVILASGGILHSRQWTQMLADIFQRPIRCAETSQASLLGGAALALAAAGGLRDVREFRYDFGRAALVEPDPGRAGYYREHYQRYLDWYHKTV